MKSRFKQLGKDSLIYGFGGVLAKSIGFLLLPVYTRIFTPAEYGTIEMLTVITSFLGTLLVMGMDSAQSFYFFQKKDEGKASQAKLVTAILQWRLLWGGLIVAAGVLISPFLSEWFFDGGISWDYFAVAFAGGLFGQVVGQSTEVFRLLYRPWPYIFITLGNTVVSASIAVGLVVILDMGVFGYFVGFTVGSSVAALVGWYAIREYVDFSSLQWKWWPKLLKFGAPLVPAAMAMYVLNTSDRWFISHYHGQDALGYYAVAAKFAMLIMFAVITFRQAWWPVAMDAMHANEDPAFFRNMAKYYLGISIIGVLLLTLLSPMLVTLLTAPVFHSAYPVVGVLAWSSILYGFYLISSMGIWKSEKTHLAAIVMAGAAVLNIALDFWLVPLHGNMGAAIATSVSFLTWNAVTILISERLWPVDYPLVRFSMQILVGVLGTGMILLLYDADSTWWVTTIVTTVLIGMILYLTASWREYVSAGSVVMTWLQRRSF